MNTDFDDADNRAFDREQHRRQACQCGNDLPGRCPGAANCPYSDYASTEDDAEQDVIAASINECETILKSLNEVDRVIDRMWRTLPKPAEDFVDATAEGIDISFAKGNLKLLSAFLHGQLARVTDPRAKNPYERDALSNGKPYVPSHERGLHKAWSQGFKTDAEREADAAERASDAADRERCGEDSHP